MLMLLRADVSNKQEMTCEFRGQQPVVVMKRSNVRGAKGHSRRLEYCKISLIVKVAVVRNELTMF